MVEKMALVSDAGENLSLTLEDGRRNLYWKEKAYGNVLWEQEALRQQLEERTRDP